MSFSKVDLSIYFRFRLNRFCKKVLQPPYDGLIKLLQRKPKYFVIDHQGCVGSVSVNRLKPTCTLRKESPSLTNTSTHSKLSKQPHLINRTNN